MGRKPGKTHPTWARYSGMGIEFAAALAGFAFVGYWVDSKYDTGPWGLVIGAALGLIGGSYNLIRESMAAFKRIDEQRDAEGDRPRDND